MDSCHGGKGLNLNLIPVSTVVNLGEFSCHGYNNKNMVKKKKTTVDYLSKTTKQMVVSHVQV